MPRSQGPQYIMPFRRRREAKTDYKLRKRLVLSGTPLLVVRRSSSYIYVDFVQPKASGDITLASANSKESANRFGFTGGKNLPTAYLTGLLAGLRAREKGIEKAVISLKPSWSVKASIPFAAAQGCMDAGVDVPMGEEAVVKTERIRGEHIASYTGSLKEQDEGRYERRFSRYLSAGLDPESLPEYFEKVKKAILRETM